jgi:hypothetical protein
MLLSRVLILLLRVQVNLDPARQAEPVSEVQGGPIPMSFQGVSKAGAFSGARVGSAQ